MLPSVSQDMFMTFQNKVMSELTNMEARLKAMTTRMEAHDQKIQEELIIHKATISTRVMATHEALREEC